MKYYTEIGIEVEADSLEQAAEKVLTYCHSGEVMALMEKYDISEPELNYDSVEEA